MGALSNDTAISISFSSKSDILGISSCKLRIKNFSFKKFVVDVVKSEADVVKTTTLVESELADTTPRLSTPHNTCSAYRTWKDKPG